MTRAAFIALFAFAILPLAVVVARAFGFPDEFAIAPVLSKLGEAQNLDALINTLSIGVGVAVFSTVVGVPLAFALARLDLPHARGLKTLLTLPCVVPPYLWAIAWIDLANPRTGLLNAFTPIFDCYTPFGIVWVLGLASFPFVMLPVHAALVRMDAALEESARLAGASVSRMIRDVTFPLVLPAIVAGASFAFLGATSAFGVPYLLGTSSAHRIPVLTTAIVQALNNPGEQKNAMILAVVLLVASIMISSLGFFAERGERRRQVVSGKGSRSRPIAIGPSARRAVNALLALVVVVAIVLPLVTLFLVSIIRAWGAGFGPSNWSAHNYYRVLFEMHETLPAFSRSLLLASVAATIAVLVGFVFAYERVRKKTLGSRVLVSIANLPYAVPGTVLALGLILAFSREIRFIAFDRVTLALDLFTGIWALLVAYTVKYLAFGVRTTTSGLMQMDPALEEAARISGASETRAAVDIVLPLLRPALVAAWLLVFLPALSEITMSVLLAGPGTSVIGTLLFELQSYADPPSAAVVACLLVGFTIGGNAVLLVATRGRGGF